MTSIFQSQQYARQPPARDASEFRPRIDVRVFPLFALQTALAQARGLPASGLLQHTSLRCALGYGRTCLLQLSNCRPRLYRLRVLRRGTQLAMNRETEGASHGAIQL